MEISSIPSKLNNFTGCVLQMDYILWVGGCLMLSTLSYLLSISSGGKGNNGVQIANDVSLLQRQ